MVTDMCTTCGLCLGSCPFDGIIDGHSQRGFPKMLIDPQLCMGCRLCIPYCPVGAIVEGEQSESMSNTARPDSQYLTGTQMIAYKVISEDSNGKIVAEYIFESLKEAIKFHAGMIGNDYKSIISRLEV